MAHTYLVPYDGSDNAKKALNWAIEYAKLTKARIEVLNIQPSFKTIHAKTLFNKHDIEEYQVQLFNETVEGVADLLRDSGVDEYRITWNEGDPKEVLVETVKTSQTGDHPIELIIMGSRGTNPFFGGVLGSVSYAMINSGVCPVTIIPQEK
ncbi:universal stress protein [Pelistega suis]|uniref:universal stress protein n=1 Tax=Pelistega suis TaxID=1631957 RepID=UPI00211B952B|nr:universal stress protein [Pelistega suis]MCQ9327914.1 universal stress protein [Pelistega suis]